MDFVLDARQLTELDNQLKEAGKALDAKTVGTAMKSSLQPMLQAAKREVPVGNKGAQFIPLKSSTKSNDYRRGGATRADLRIKVVEGVGGEVVRGLVGVSKQSGKVGWRTHFITRGTKRGQRANDFLGRAAGQTFNLTVSQLSEEDKRPLTGFLAV